MEDAARHCAEGLGIWAWASNDMGAVPDVVDGLLRGDVPTLPRDARGGGHPAARAADLKRCASSAWSTLTKLQPPRDHPHGLPDADFDALFTVDRPVVFAFHGYPDPCPQAHVSSQRPRELPRPRLQGRAPPPRLSTCACAARSTASIVASVLDLLPEWGARTRTFGGRTCATACAHHTYIREHGDDMPEVRDWKR